MTDTQNQSDYGRALHAEPRLQTVVNVVDALATLARPTDALCSSCIWEHLVKPMIVPLIGWERGYLPQSAKDPAPGENSWRPVSAAELLGSEERRTPATTETEKWLRSSEAWNGFVGPLLKRLEVMDPGNGHGIGPVDSAA
ncbi:hypothetical protein [Streptomyces sp. NPDC052107]|uniref:hypothetical protein n=1 Tax=Streptomyces sp. NPDC052107 TaxID=3155632 RepID=UPI0034148446